MKIKVKQQHIKNGIREDPSRCPAALALIDAGFEGVSVEDHKICISTVKIKTPKLVKQFIAQFDDEKPVKPFTFEIPFSVNV